MVSDQVLAWVKTASAGDQGAFERLVETYERPVCAIAYSLVGDRAASEDVAQEAFIAAWNGLGQLRSPERFSSWLYAITRNLAKSALREGIRERRATSLTDAEAKAVAGPDSNAEVADTADAVWDSLEKLPDHYREVMVMYYREGESISAVAESLGLTEACVKQRLSRGREKLRDKVAHLVEDVLRSTGPSSGFASGVVAGLALTSTQMAVAQTGLAAAAGKSAAASGTGAGFAGAAFWLGPLLGMTGGFFGMWASIRNTPTLAVRRFMLIIAAYTYGFVWLFLGYQGLCGILLWETPWRMAAACGAGWFVYLIALALFIWKSNTRAQRIVAAEHSEDEREIDIKLVNSYTQPRVWRAFGIGIPIGILGSAGVVWWTYSLPAVSWVMGLAVALICHAMFTMLYRYGASMAADEVAFEATAPNIEPMNWLGRTMPSTTDQQQPTLSNDIGALAGGIVGGAAWLFIACLQAGDFAVGAGYAVVIIAILAGAIVVRKNCPDLRRWVFFWSLMACGIVTAAVIGGRWRRLFEIEEYLAAIYDLMAGLIVFGIYGAIATAILLAIRPQEKTN